MNNMIQNSFHGLIEPVREAKMILPTWGLEAIEIIFAVGVLYFIFFRFLIKMIETEKKTGYQEIQVGQGSGVVGALQKGAFKK